MNQKEMAEDIASWASGSKKDLAMEMLVRIYDLEKVNAVLTSSSEALYSLAKLSTDVAIIEAEAAISGVPVDPNDKSAFIAMLTLIAPYNAGRTSLDNVDEVRAVLRKYLDRIEAAEKMSNKRGLL